MQNKEQKRDMMIKAALEVFGEEGFEKATVETIAKNAGVGKGTIYEYFSSKQQLFVETIQCAVEYLIGDLAEALEKKETVAERLKMFYMRNLELVKRQPEFHTIMMRDLGKIPPDLHQWVLEKQHMLVKKVEAILLEGVKQGEITCPNPHVFAYMVVSSLHVAYIYEQRTATALEHVVEEQIKIITNSLERSKEET